MTPEQALQILDQAAALAAMSRKDHALIRQAVQVLAETIKELAETKTET